MDSGNTGIVSKAQFMQFMEQEFDRCDMNHNGTLDAAELSKFHIVAPAQKHTGGTGR